jgi:hypothetical protein
MIKSDCIRKSSIPWIVLGLAMCGGCTYKVPLVNNLSSTSAGTAGKKLPIKVGLLLDEGTKNLKETVKPSGIGGTGQKYVFPVGDMFSKLMLDAGKMSFEKVKALDSLPRSFSKDVDAYLIVKDLRADIQIIYTNMDTAIAFGLIGQMVNPVQSKTDAALSASVQMLDANFNNLFSSTLRGEGHSQVPSAMMETKPEEFSGGVNDAARSLVNDIIKKISNSQKIVDTSQASVSPKTISKEVKTVASSTPDVQTKPVSFNSASLPSSMDASNLEVKGEKTSVPEAALSQSTIPVSTGPVVSVENGLEFRKKYT